jgi:hypothetical protein
MIEETALGNADSRDQLLDPGRGKALLQHRRFGYVEKALARVATRGTGGNFPSEGFAVFHSSRVSPQKEPIAARGRATWLTLRWECDRRGTIVMYSILLATLAIVLLAALPTLPYSATGRSRYQRAKSKRIEPQLSLG